MERFEFDITDGLAVLTLNNPPQNRMDAQFTLEMTKILQRLRMGGIRALVIKSNGPNFSFGGAFYEWVGTEPSQLRTNLSFALDAMKQFETLPYPVIAAVQGGCWGGGFEFALCCDMIVATPDAHFNHPEKTLAITTLLGGVYRLAERVGKNVAAELAYTSSPLGAERLHQLGVVNQIVDASEIEEYALKLGRELADGPTLAHAAHKKLLKVWSEHGISAADEVLLDLSIPLFSTEDTQRALDAAVTAFKSGDKRPDLKFNGK